MNITVFDWIKRYKIFILVVLVLLGVNVVFFYVSPQQIVSSVGVQNSYLIIFGVAAIGGVSTLTGAALYATIATFAAGGATPWILGIVAGLGIFISNSVFFWLALYGRRSVPDQWKTRIQRWSAWLDERVPRNVQLILAYFYLGFSPFPDDILMIGLVLSGFTYRKVAPVLLLGGITIATATAYLGNSGFNFLFQ